jgi:hypothetical protein
MTTETHYLRLLSALDAAIATIEYLRPETFDDAEHEAGFDQRLHVLKSILTQARDAQ